MAYGEALHALADPTRRAILERLRRGQASVTDIARELPVSRPAVSQHLRVLKSAGLVAEERRGVHRIYRVEIRGVVALRRYLDSLWEDVLGSLQQAVMQQSAERPGGVPRPHASPRKTSKRKR